MSSKTQEIRAIEGKYGLVLFKMGLAYMADVGIRHLTDEHVKEAVTQITANDEAERAAGVGFRITGEFQCEIVRCAAELAKFPVWELFAYIKNHVFIADKGGMHE